VSGRKAVEISSRKHRVEAIEKEAVENTIDIRDQRLG